MGRHEEQVKKVNFARKTEPVLYAGKWKLEVSQELSGHAALSASGVQSEEFLFSCEADSDVMDVSQVYSVYPPRDSFGRFEMTLPCIVLKRRTLPWERKIPECPNAPWLALLLFSEEENVTLGTVQRGPDDKYMELEIPADLFYHVCPTAEDMALAVHSRFTSRDDKATESEKVDEWMSVVTAGRLPCSDSKKNGLKNTVYLVSMEKAGQMILDRSTIPGKKLIRLPVLACWSFYSRQETYNFSVLFEGLSAGTLRIPWQKRADAQSAGETVERLLERGYAPVNHMLRDGGRTVSWYHGPLRPWNVEVSVEPYRLFSDGGMIYDPAMGMFDISISAAYELGRMLAMQDGAFSKALVEFRENKKRAAAKNHNRYMLNTVVQKAVLESREKADHGKTDPERGAATEDVTASLHRLAVDILLQDRQEHMVFFPAADDQAEEIPPEIIQPLARWSLLYDVPYRYLVPDRNILPPESIRFFYIDYNWLTAMLDGAMSMGRLFDVDYQCDSETIQRVIEEVYLSMTEIRPRLQHKKEEELREQLFDRRDEMRQRRDCNKDSKFLSTGFLLRSDLVKGWRGLEFRAYADQERKTKPLTALRLEVTGQDILLGIYLGRIASLEIAQPPEGVHLGFEKNESGGYRKMLRSPLDGAPYDREQIYADVVMRDRNYGMMDWKATADRIRAALPLEVEMDSAYMALEMIQTPAVGIVQEK